MELNNKEINKFNCCICEIDDLQNMVSSLSAVLRREVSIIETNVKGIYVLDCVLFTQTPISLYSDIEVITHVENNNVYVNSIQITNNYM